jgi:7-cyano-7-deazaguanine synthase
MENRDRERAVVLLSGGMDSATVLAYATSKGFECYTLSVNYGQHCQRELEAARKLADRFSVARHMEIPIGLDRFGGSALVENRPIPKADEAAREFGVPETYVPARNTVFLSLALGWAEVLKAYTIFIGANSIDYSGYPDCRPEYVEAFNRMAATAVAEGSSGGRSIRVEAPLMDLSKAEIIMMGRALGLDYGLTVSCYQPTPDGLACGECESCLLRLRGFAEAGCEDPLPYAG